ncbi:MAG: Gfo/Idh/MocA family oxidoreductase [Verrucomicrobiae bacterium]|nr:Gfo/Idh/MocA family oxidoreductase [Verrucomicrobiae bacterium]
MKKTLRLGVVGHGGRISGVIKSCLRSIEPDLRVVGIVDPDQENARTRLDECDRKDVVFYKTLDEMVRKANLDALAIGTRCNLHAPFAIQAARYDIPLYLEKPVAISMSQALSLEKAFRKTRCKVVVSFPLRVSPLCLMTRKLIEEGAVGRPDHIAALNYVPYGTCYWDFFYRYYNISHGLFLQKATHDLDYMSHLMGSNIVRIAAMGNYGRIFGGKKPAGLRCSKCKEQDTCLESPQNRKRNSSGGTTEDHLCTFSVDCGTPKSGTNEDCSSALVEFASGAHGIYTQVFFSRRDAQQRGATVSGYEGTLSFDWYKNELRRIRHHAPFSDTIKPGEGLSHFGGDTELAHDFINLVRGKIKKSRTPIETGIQSAYACLAATQSARTGRFVKVRQVGQ